MKTKEDLNTILLEEMLRRKGTSIARVKRWKKEPPWYVRLSWDTHKEEDDFRKWWSKTVRKHLGLTKRGIEREWLWWSLSYGLRSAYLDKEAA